jgi:hypothetical protein
VAEKYSREFFSEFSYPSTIKAWWLDQSMSLPKGKNAGVWYKHPVTVNYFPFKVIFL